MAKHRLEPQADEGDLDIAVADYLDRTDRGERIDQGEFLAQHPRIAEGLRAFFAASDLVESYVAGQSAAHLELGSRDTASVAAADQTLPLEARDSALPAGMSSTFGRYLILASLGQGSMGSVYLAFDTQLDRLIALKIPNFSSAADSAAIARFYREARSAATLRHPYICPVFDVGQIGERHFLSMAYIEGPNLAKFLEGNQPLGIPQTVQIVRKLALALDEAHRQGVLHRDLKPANIMLDPKGDPIVTDFGLARRIDHDPALTSSGALVGSPTYMSPEQVRGNPEQIGPASDIYTLGVILYQLLTGQTPFRGTILSIMPQIMYVPPLPPSQLRPELQAWPALEAACLRMMAKDPRDRFATMAEVAQTLGAIVGGPPDLLVAAEPAPPPIADQAAPPIVVRPPPVPVKTPRWLRSPGAVPLANLVALCLIVVLAVPLGGMLWNGRLGRPNRPIADTPPQPASPSKPGPQVAQQTPPVTPPRVAPAPAPPPAPQPEPKIAVPPATPPIVLAASPRIESVAVVGQPFGTGRLDVLFEAGEGPRLCPDQAVQLLGQGDRVFYPAYETEFEAEPAESQELVPTTAKLRRLRRLTARFLIRGDGPLDVSLAIDGRKLIESRRVEPSADASEAELLRPQWWSSFQTLPAERITKHACEVKNYLNSMLSRRLALPPPQHLTAGNENSSVLERVFEEAAGKLLGFDSVTVGLASIPAELAKLGMERADRPLPPPINIRSVPLDKRAKTGAVEELARHVPQECLYLRFQNAANHLWFRKLLLDWGGNLEEVVAARTHDHQFRPRIERQLALVADEPASAALAPVLSDLALIAMDTNFEDGAAVGVLFQTQPGQSGALQAWIEQQRTVIRAQNPDNIRQQTIATPAGFPAVLLSSRDGRVRSYYAVDGNHHLVANCQRLVERFFEAGRGQGNLAMLEEFRLARGKFDVVEPQDTFLYLSDPFFRNMAQPAYRIEALRRGRSATDLRRLELARLAARREGLPNASLDDLVEGGWLPAYYTQRQDGIKLAIAAGVAYDEQRGLPGTFYPIPDTCVDLATDSEIVAYRRFADEMRREWGVMDPVAVVLRRTPLAGGREQLKLDIKVVPYAKGRYETLTKALGQASTVRVAHPRGDVLCLEAALQTQRRGQFLGYFGLSDADIKFAVTDGEIRIVNPEVGGRTYAAARSYLALNRCDRDAVDVIENLWRSAGLQIPSGYALLRGLVLLPDRILGVFLGRFSPAPPNRDQSFLPVPVAGANGWGSLALNQAQGERSAAALEARPTSDGAAQLRFSMSDIRTTQVYSYIRAHSFLEARRASARNANLMDLMLDQFQVPPGELDQALETALGVKLTCPLGGKLQVGTSAAGPYSLSNRWRERSYVDATAEAPAGYEFAFVSWLRGFQLRFQLDAETLSAQADLEIHPTSSGDLRSPKR